MGYYTEHNLDLLNSITLKQINDDEKYKIISDLRFTDDNINYVIDSTGKCKDRCKWYEKEDDLLIYSKFHPTIIFELTCNGDDNEDNYILYFLNGKMTRCEGKIVYEQLDINKLK